MERGLTMTDDLDRATALAKVQAETWYTAALALCPLFKLDTRRCWHTKRKHPRCGPATCPCVEQVVTLREGAPDG